MLSMQNFKSNLTLALARSDFKKQNPEFCFLSSDDEPCFLGKDELVSFVLGLGCLCLVNYSC